MTFEARDRGIKSEGKILKDVFLLTNCVCSSQTSVFDTNLHLITMLDTHMLFTVWEVRMANYCMRGPKITSDFFFRFAAEWRGKIPDSGPYCKKLVTIARLTIHIRGSKMGVICRGLWGLRVSLGGTDGGAVVANRVQGGEDCRKLTANEMPLRGIIGYY